VTAAAARASGTDTRLELELELLIKCYADHVSGRDFSENIVFDALTRTN